MVLIAPRPTGPGSAARAGVAAGVWLGVRLQLLAALLVTSVAGLAVLSHQVWIYIWTFLSCQVLI